MSIERWFTYHSPKGNQPVRYEAIRSAGKDLALVIMNNCPESKEKTVAIRKIREAVMYANASIACNE